MRTAATGDRFVAEHPRSKALYERARAVMPGGVPMSWMVKWPGPFPVFVAEAAGAHFRDVDGHDYAAAAVRAGAAAVTRPTRAMVLAAVVALRARRSQGSWRHRRVDPPWRRRSHCQY